MILIHKKSHGVLVVAPDDSRNCAGIPLARSLTCKRLGLAPEEWWEVDPHTVQGIRATRYYPCFDVLTTEDGRLLDIQKWSKRKTKMFDRGVKPRKRDWRHCHNKKSRLWREKKC